jgi:hypothetical protein
MVTVVLTGPPAGVTLAGANEHVAPAGSPLQAKVTAPVKPAEGVTVICVLALEPAATVSAEADALTRKGEPAPATRQGAPMAASQYWAMKATGWPAEAGVVASPEIH